MITSCSIFKQFGFIRSFSSITSPLPAMAFLDQKFLSDDDPWEVSTFVSAVMKLFLSILLLLGAVITFFTSRVGKVVGFEPPCTYLGCSHPLLPCMEGSKEKKTLVLRDHAAKDNGLDACSGKIGCGADHQCSCSNNSFYKRGIRSKRPRLGIFAHTYSNGKLHKVQQVLSSARSISKSNDRSGAGDCYELYHKSTDLEHEGSCKAPDKRADNVFSHDRDTLLEDAIRVHVSIDGKSNIEETSSGMFNGIMEVCHKEELCDRKGEDVDETYSGMFNGIMAFCHKEGLCDRKGEDVDERTRFVHHEEPFRETVLDESMTVEHALKNDQACDAGTSAELLGKKSRTICEHKGAFKEREESVSVHDATWTHYSEATQVSALQDNQACNAESSLEFLSKISWSPAEQEGQKTLEEETVTETELKAAPKKMDGVRETNHDSHEIKELGELGPRDEQEGAPEAAYIINEIVYEDLSAVGHIWVGNATSQVHASSCKEADNVESPSESLENISSVHNKEHLDMGPTNFQENQGYIQFGSIVACIEDATACNYSVDSSRPENTFLGVAVAKFEDVLQKIVINEYSKDIEVENVENKLGPPSPDQGACLKKAMVTLLVSEQNVEVEPFVESPNASSSKDWIILECNQGELFLQDPVERVEDTIGDANVTKRSLVEPLPRNVISAQGPDILLAELCEGLTPLADTDALMPPIGDSGEGEVGSVEGEEEEGVDALKKALEAERSILAVLEAELDNERNAAAVATNEAMAMISRLQEEKSAMQMEVAQLQRMSEERADYDEQAMAVLKEILFKREAENMALEKEVEVYRERILAGKGSEPNEAWLKGVLRNFSLHPRCNRLMLTDEEMESWPPLRLPLSTSSERIYPFGNRTTPSKPQSRPNLEVEELDTIPVHHVPNKSLRNSSSRNELVGSPSRPCGDGRSSLDCSEASLQRAPRESYWHAEMARYSSSTDVESFLAPDCRWVPEVDLQELQVTGQKLFTTETDEGQHLTYKLAEARSFESPIESYGAQTKEGLRNEDLGEVDGGCSGFMPIHDVYEVYSTSTRSPPGRGERDPAQAFDDVSQSQDWQLRKQRLRIEIPPKTSLVTKPIVALEFPSTPSSTTQTTVWDVKSIYPENVCDNDALQLQSLVPREDQGIEIQQLALRLKALEEDKELLRKTIESFKFRDSEFNLLKDIAQHLQELRLAGGSLGVSGGFQLHDTVVTSPNRFRAPKKRRYCSGPGQAHTLFRPLRSV